MPSLLLSWWHRLRGSDSLGARGERLAARWLKRRKSFRILARNWRSPRDHRDELDLVCLDGEVLVFVEVKTRAASALVQGYDAIDERKRRVLCRAAEAYLAGLRPQHRPRTVRCDAVEIAWPAEGQPVEPEVRHFENIPVFGKHLRCGE
jgi:putative endonuclease